MPIPRHIVDLVRERIDIAEVIGRHVGLQQRGNSLLGLCPFHQEKSPSFSVNPDKGLFYCFGCQAGGDAFSFLMKIEGMSFGEAVRELAGSAGVAIEDRQLSAEERERFDRKATLRDALEHAAAYYESALWGEQGQRARAYLEQRGIERETARTARLGFAPDSWTALLDHLHRRRIAPDLAEAAGLARRRRTGSGHYDAFRNRLVFPIRDERGRVIGFGGRIMEGDGPKYINSPETELYQKSSVLYGIDGARAGIQRNNRVLVVEGYFDVISLHQAGFTEAIATCGTALTQEHLERLRRLTRNIVLVLDADEAGSRAAERCLPMCVEAGMQAWRLIVPDAKDPDELIREHGAEALEEALGRREPLVEWYVQRTLDRYGADASGTERVLDEISPILGRLSDTLVSRVAARLRVPEEAVRRRVRVQPQQAPPASQAPAGGWRPHRSVVHLLWLLVHRHEQVAPLAGRVDLGLLAAHAPARPAIERLIAGEPVAALLGDDLDPGVRRTLSAVVARTELYTPEQAPRGICDVLCDLAEPLWDAELRRLTGAIDRISRDGSGNLDALRARQALVRRKTAIRKALSEEDLEGCVTLLAPPEQDEPQR